MGHHGEVRKNAGGLKDREVVTPPKKKVEEAEEEMPEGMRKEPPTMRVGDEVMRVNAPPQRKQPLAAQRPLPSQAC